MRCSLQWQDVEDDVAIDVDEESGKGFEHPGSTMYIHKHESNVTRENYI